MADEKPATAAPVADAKIAPPPNPLDVSASEVSDFLAAVQVDKTAAGKTIADQIAKVDAELADLKTKVETTFDLEGVKDSVRTCLARRKTLEKRLADLNG